MQRIRCVSVDTQSLPTINMGAIMMGAIVIDMNCILVNARLGKPPVR